MNRSRILRGLLAIAVATACTWAQDAQPTAKPMPTSAAPAQAMRPATSDTNPQFSERNPRYKVHAGDVVAITFKFSPEFDQTVSVQPDGYVSLAEAGDVFVQGLTSPEISAAVKKAYSNILNDPVVTVVLKEFDKPFFVAGGAIGKPGKYEMPGDLTLVQAINVAGGFTEDSKHSEVWLYRTLPNNQVQSRKINVKSMLAKGDLREDVRLQPGDMVFVPQNTLSKLKGAVIPRLSIGPSLKP